MLSMGQSLVNLLRARVGQSKEPNGIDGRIAENSLRGVVDCGIRKLLAGQMARGRADVVDGGDLPKVTFPHGRDETAPHPAVPENARPEPVWHAISLMVGGSLSA